MSEPESDISQIARDVLEILLSNLGVAASVELDTLSFVEETEDAAPVALSVSGEDLGILIGRRGQTLACLQYIVINHFYSKNSKVSDIYVIFKCCGLLL